MIPLQRWHLAVSVLALLLGAALVGAATTARGMPAGTASAAASTTYTDPAGDSQGAPDVTRLQIEGDAATGAMTFWLTVTGYPLTAAPGQDYDAIIWLDTDKNSATGDPRDGTEYGLQSWVDSTGSWWAVARWNGTNFEGTGQSATESFTRMHSTTEDILKWTLNASDLGGATSFRFYVAAGTRDVAAKKYIAWDKAPDSGRWEYSPTATPPAPAPPAEVKAGLAISVPTTIPKVALAGKRFSVSFPVSFWVTRPSTTIEIGTGETKKGTVTMITPVERGKMVCDPSIAGRVIPHKESLKNGQARLSFVIPATAKGKLLKVKVKITATEKDTGKTFTASKIATFRVH